MKNISSTKSTTALLSFTFSNIVSVNYFTNSSYFCFAVYYLYLKDLPDLAGGVLSSYLFYICSYSIYSGRDKAVAAASPNIFAPTAFSSAPL